MLDSGLVARRPGRLVVVADDVGGVDDLDVGASAGSSGRTRASSPTRTTWMLRAGGLQRAPHDLGGRVVAAGRVDHDAHDAIAVGARSRRP